jgi:large repetitive protein
VRRRTKAAVTLATMLSTVAALAVVAAGPASATYRPPSIRQVCGGTLESSVCVLPPGVTTAPNNYSATIAVTKTGITGATVTFAVTAGSLPPGLTMPAQGGSGTVISGNPTKAGTYGFTVKATDGSLTSTLAYQITVTVQGLPDQLLCTAGNGSFLINGACVLPDAVLGLPYAGHLPTSHQAGGTLSIISGALPPGLTLPATFGTSGDTISGTPAQADNGNTYSFTVQGTGDQGQPLYQAYQISVDPNLPLTVVLPAGGPGGTASPALYPRPVGVAGGADFFSGGGAAPYTWALISGKLPPGLTLQTDSCCGPRYANDELAGTPTTAGTYTFTMQVSDYDGQQATQQFSLIIYLPLQVSTTTLPAGTVGVAYSRDLIAQGGVPPYTWSLIADNALGETLPPGLTLGTTAPGSGNVLTGTPTQAGTFSFPMQVEDSLGFEAQGTVTVTIDP